MSTVELNNVVEGKSLGVMQPYLFPYLGYYQLVMAVDEFVFYDDVTFIKRGYINRNKILSNGKPQRFTLPISGSSQNKFIKDLFFDGNVKKVLKSITQNYSKAPYFYDVYPLIESILTDGVMNVSCVCSNSIKKVFEYLSIEKKFRMSSTLDYDRTLPATDKLISISKNLDAEVYVNSIGGETLYDKKHFIKNGVKLLFIEMKPLDYCQGGKEFVTCLSMIDVLMWNSKEKARQLLMCYELK